jgi:hypothetical protein
MWGMKDGQYLVLFTTRSNQNCFRVINTAQHSQRELYCGSSDLFIDFEWH